MFKIVLVTLVFIFASFPSVTLGVDQSFEHRFGPIFGAGIASGGNKEIVYTSLNNHEELFRAELTFNHRLIWVGTRLFAHRKKSEGNLNPTISGYVDIGVFTGERNSEQIIHSLTETGLFLGTGINVKILNIGFRYFNSNGSFNGSFSLYPGYRYFSGNCQLKRYMGEVKLDYFISPVISIGTQKFSPGGIHQFTHEDEGRLSLESSTTTSWMVGLEIDLLHLFEKK